MKGRKTNKPSSRAVDKAAEREAAIAFEREHDRHELERAREVAIRQKEREHRQQAVDKAQGALDKAEREHLTKAAAIQAEVEVLEKRLRTEDARWHKEKERLETALAARAELGRARDSCKQRGCSGHSNHSSGHSGQVSPIVSSTSRTAATACFEETPRGGSCFATRRARWPA